MHATWFKGAVLDKDSIKPGNREYCKEFCRWTTNSENVKEMRTRFKSSPKKCKSNIVFDRESIRRVRCIETKETFKFCRDAEKKYNLSKGSVSSAANPNSNQKTAGGYHWEYIK